MDALASINDKLSVLIELQKKKPKRPVPYARPKTALSKVRAERDLAKRKALHERLTAQLVPGSGP
ncbi:MAG TPA: hypothetical protein VL242_23920 [Sorangium sp.]|nr:hypothetical protein [Sorangium sp.]